MRFLNFGLLIALTLTFMGCNSEIRGLTKPRPNIKWANVYRTSSAAAIQTNRISFWVTEFACYRTVGTDKLYLDFQYERAEATSDGGKAIYVLSNWSNETLQKGYTYYILAGIGAEIYDYDYASTRSNRESVIADRIVQTRTTDLARELTASEQEKVSELAKLICAEQDRNVTLKLDKSKSAFVPVQIKTQPVTREYYPTTNAYDAGLWECLPDGTSRQIL